MTNKTNSRNSRQSRVIADPMVARVVTEPYHGLDNGDAMEVGRTRAAALARWLRENQHRDGGDALSAVLRDMQKALPATRHAFLEHIAHLVALGGQHVDLGADLEARTSSAGAGRRLP